MKKIILFPTFFGFLFSSIFINHDNKVDAATIGTTYSSCSSVSSKTVYESVPSAGSSSQTKSVHTHPLVEDTSKIVSQTKDPKTGKVLSTTYGTKIKETTVDTPASCTPGSPSISGTQYSGKINYTYKFTGGGSKTTSVTHEALYVTGVKASVSKSYKLSTTSSNPSFSCVATYPNGATTTCGSGTESDSGKSNNEREICQKYSKNSRTSTACYKIYYPTKVTITTTKSSSTTDTSMPTFNCVITYKNGDTTSCTNLMTASSSSYNNGLTKKTCYYYTINGFSDETCTDRHHLKSLEITGSTKSYSGIKQNYVCKATFADGTVRNISDIEEIWSSTPYQHMGSDKHVGFTVKLMNTSTRATQSNQFYPVSNVDTNYVIKCVWNPYTSNSQVSDYTNKSQSKTFNVKNYGVGQMKIEVSGNFYDDNNPGKFIYINNLISPDATDTSYVRENFMTAGWYDFRAYIKYTDGTNGSGSSSFREVTNAPEILWTQSGDFPSDQYLAHNSKMWTSGGKLPINKNTNTSGLDSRIPQNGKNEIYAMYLYTGNPGEIVTDNRVRDGIKIFAREIINLEIKGSTYETLPATNVTGDTTQRYYAWVTFSDDPSFAPGIRNPIGKGGKQDWSKGVIWKSDFLTNTPGQLKIPRGNQTISLSASYTDSYNLKNVSNWDSHGDSIYIKVTDNCNSITKPTDGCGIPNIWNVKDFKTKQNNYQPPASAYGYTSWDDENSFYKYIQPFKVTGVSTGVGQGQ